MDAFQFQISRSKTVSNTKRSILSTIAKLFDPLGWSMPVTVTAKIFLQRLWQLKLDWDETLPIHFLSQWESIQASLAELHNLQLDRRSSDTVHCELHGFSDASTAAYVAAVYMRLLSRSGGVTAMLLIGKSKVAPVKSLSVPRLELAAAVLLTKLMEFVRTSLNLTTVPCYCWTDSTIVLAWVSQHPSKWKTFVSNWVSEIQSRIPSASWRHVSTADNPADCASRGIPGNQISTHALWWHGPAWLRLPPSDWPLVASPTDISLEQKTRIIAHFTQPSEPWELASRYSSWPKLIRVTAYIIRYVSRLRSPVKPRNQYAESSSSLSADECQVARTFWLKQIQRDIFPLERAALLQKKSVSSKSSILSLNPFLGDDELIRVGGRLTNAPLPIPTKHPIILVARFASIGCDDSATHASALSACWRAAYTGYSTERIFDRSRPEYRKIGHSSLHSMYPRKGRNSLPAHGQASVGARFPSSACVSAVRTGLCWASACPIYVGSWGRDAQIVYSDIYMHGNSRCSP